MNLTFPVQSESELLFIVLGIALLLGGWLIFLLGTRILSIGVGVGLGFFIGEILSIVLKVDRNTGLYVAIGCAVMGGLGALLIIKAVSNFLFAVLGLLLGAMVGRIAAEVYADWHNIPFALNSQSAVIILPAAIISALAAIWMQRFIMILITSYMGSIFLAESIPYLSRQAWGFIALFLFGIAWQLFVVGRMFRKSRQRDEVKKSLKEDANA